MESDPIGLDIFFLKKNRAHDLHSYCTHTHTHKHTRICILLIDRLILLYRESRDRLKEEIEELFELAKARPEDCVERLKTLIETAKDKRVAVGGFKKQLKAIEKSLEGEDQNEEAAKQKAKGASGISIFKI